MLMQLCFSFKIFSQLKTINIPDITGAILAKLFGILI